MFRSRTCLCWNEYHGQQHYRICLRDDTMKHVFLHLKHHACLQCHVSLRYGTCDVTAQDLYKNLTGCVVFLEVLSHFEREQDETYSFSL